MISVNDRIIVRVNMAQKNYMLINGVVFQTAMKWEVNYREKSPVVAQVVSGNNILREGDILLTHHNHYHGNSPYFLMDDLFSVPFNRQLFAKLKTDGSIEPICDNVLGERIDIETDLPIPVEERKKHKDRIRVLYGGTTKFRKDDLIFTRASAPYDICYFVNQIERKITKVSDDMIVGYIKKYFASVKNT